MCGNNNQKLDLLLAFSIADTKQDHYFVPETVDTGVDTRIVPFIPSVEWIVQIYWKTPASLKL